MALEKFNWQNGSQVEPAKVEVDGVVYEVTEAQFEGETPLSAANLNLMQDTILGNVKDNLDDDTKIPSCKAVKDIYSTDEVKTNEVWIDGKPIYRKVLKDITVTSNMNTTISTGLSNVNIIKIYGEYHTANYNITQPIPYISSNKEYVIEVIAINSGSDIRYRTASSFNGQSNIVLEYTKSS